MPASPDALNPLPLWKGLLRASRPQTWIASLSPVAIGAVLAGRETSLDLFSLLCTLGFSLGIQIGTNYTNDVCDFLQGADHSLREGPPRATQQGWVSPSAMKQAATGVFATALVFAWPLMQQAGMLWSFPLALLCIACGVFYTAQPIAFGYRGLGDLFVFLFFGPIPVLGTYFLQTHTLSPSILLASVAPGSLSTTLLIANHLRDETSDRYCNKRTLVVRWGKRFGQVEYTLFSCIHWTILSYFLFPISYGSGIAWAIYTLLVGDLLAKVWRFSSSQQAAPLLGKSARMLFLYTLFFCFFMSTK